MPFDPKDQAAAPGDGDAAGAIVRSSLRRDVHAVFARANVEALHREFLAHAASLGPLPDEPALTVMRQALGAAVLQLALLPPDEFCSWTFNLASPPLNVFLAGDNNEFQVTGRIYTDDVRVASAGRLFVETQRPAHLPSRSVVEFEGTDVLAAMRQFYGRALQMRARIFELGEHDVLLIQGLPIVDEDWLRRLDAAAAQQAEEGAERIEERRYRFRCGCDARRITLVVHEMFAGPEKLDELFGGDPEIEVQCPRCGRRWWLSRASLEGGQA
jgi:molecular chaperone Hsp33